MQDIINAARQAQANQIKKGTRRVREQNKDGLFGYVTKHFWEARSNTAKIGFWAKDYSEAEAIAKTKLKAFHTITIVD